MPDQALAQLGNSLRDARLKCGLTQEKLAETANLSKKYISSIERGKSNPTYDVLRRLIIALDIPAEALFLPIISITQNILFVNRFGINFT